MTTERTKIDPKELAARLLSHCANDYRQMYCGDDDLTLSPGECVRAAFNEYHSRIGEPFDLKYVEDQIRHSALDCVGAHHRDFAILFSRENGVTPMIKHDPDPAGKSFPLRPWGSSVFLYGLRLEIMDYDSADWLAVYRELLTMEMK